MQNAIIRVKQRKIHERERGGGRGEGKEKDCGRYVHHERLKRDERIIAVSWIPTLVGRGETSGIAEQFCELK